ncbi:MAG: hypothetical protein DRI46_10340 [Chloroflexi bacterium]|nr:MAG: hypothetical protein DRI46_10340 [Chloroflexota bacterium]
MVSIMIKNKLLKNHRKYLGNVILGVHKEQKKGDVDSFAVAKIEAANGITVKSWETLDEAEGAVVDAIYHVVELERERDKLANDFVIRVDREWRT